MPRQSKKTPASREVVYPTLTVSGVEIPLENTRVTREQNLAMLGWEAESEDVKFGEDYVLIDEMGRKVRLANNAGNRPYHDSVARGYMQDILNGHWMLNGETIILGEFGDILSGQHRGIGFELSCQRREGWVAGQMDEAIKAHWMEKHPEEPTLSSLVVCGIPQSGEVIRTIDNVRPRSEADVIYTSGVFDKLPPKAREKASKTLAFAVKLLWYRAGHDADAYSPIRTRSEIMDFVARHEHLKGAVEHILGEDADDKKSGKISFFCPLGTAAGLLYLMGCSDSNGEKYRDKEVKSEAGLNWGKWKAAKEFWSLLAAGDKSVQTVVNARIPVEGEPQAENGSLSRSGFCFAETGPGGSAQERIGVIIKAWLEWSQGNKITPGIVKLNYDVEWADDGTLMSAVLDENPVIGGIDAEMVEPEPDEDDPEEIAEIEERKAEVDKTKAEVPAASGKGTPDDDLNAVLDANAKKHPGVLLLYKGNTYYTAYRDDAVAMGKILGLPKKKHPGGLIKAQFPHYELDKQLPKLHAENLVVGVATGEGEEFRVTVLEKRKSKPVEEPAPVETPAEAPKPKPVAKKPVAKKPALRGGIG